MEHERRLLRFGQEFTFGKHKMPKSAKPASTYRLLKNDEATKHGDEQWLTGYGWKAVTVDGWRVYPYNSPCRRLDDGLGDHILLKPTEYVRATDEIYLKGDWIACASHGSAKDWKCGESIIRRARRNDGLNLQELGFLYNLLATIAVEESYDTQLAKVMKYDIGEFRQLIQSSETKVGDRFHKLYVNGDKT